MSVPDIQKLGGPIWLSIAAAGLVAGGALTSLAYESLRIPALQDRELLAQQKAASTEALLEKNEALFKQLRGRVDELTIQLKSRESPAEFAQLQGNHAQCLRNNEQWQTAYATVAAQANLQRQVERLEREYSELAAAVVNYTAHTCRNAQNPGNCDLIPTDQRTLQAMQMRRDQTHARLLQLQDKLACSKP